MRNSPQGGHIEVEDCRNIFYNKLIVEFAGLAARFGGAIT